MKGITTIAALPSGAGQSSHLPAEVGEARAPGPVWGSKPIDPYFGYPTLGLVVSPVIGEAVDPVTGARGGANRKQLPFVTVDKRASDQIASLSRAMRGPRQAFRFQDWDRHYKGEPLIPVPPEGKP